MLDEFKEAVMRIRLLGWLTLGVSLLLLVLVGCSRDSGPTTDGISDQPTEQVVDTPVVEPLDQPDEIASSPVEQANGDVMATVNGVPISRDWFERTKQQVLSQYQQIYSQFGQDVRTMLGGAQGRLFDLRIQDEALEQATTRALVLGELDARNAPISEDEVNAEFQRQFDEFLTVFGMEEEAFEIAFNDGALAGYQTGDLTYEQFIGYAKQSVREEYEIQAIQTVIAGTLEYTPEDLVAFFDEHRSNYDIAEQVNASHILVSDEALAQQLVDELAAGADFATLALEHSIDTGSGARGGDLGWFERGRMVASFEEAAFTTPVGELSDIIVTEYGYHIVWVTGYQPEEKPEYDEVAEHVTTDFETEVKSQRFAEWYELARPAAEITITEPMLDAFRKQETDLDAGLQAFLDIRDEGIIDDLYLNYIIGTIYETKMDVAVSKKLGIQGNETLTPSQQAEITNLDVEIERLRSQAVASYEQALAVLGSEPEIETRIENLTPNEAEVTSSD
jgi:foldase protein PrsA